MAKRGTTEEKVEQTEKIEPGTIVTIPNGGRIFFKTGEGVDQVFNFSQPGENFEMVKQGNNSTTLKAIERPGQPTFTIPCRLVGIG